MAHEPERLHRVSAVDLALGVLALAFGAFSLAFPLGRDQGLYYYVGREWALRGSIPYRDILDHKTPGIYVVHSAAIHLFGDRAWGYRVFELFLVVVLGLVAASLTRRVGAPRRGVRGGAVLAAFVLYWGFFDFWNTGQSEVWYSTIGLGAVAASVRVRNLRSAALIAGAIAGAALVMKPPSIFFGFLAWVLIVLRYADVAPETKTERRRLQATRVAWGTVFFGIGVAVPVLLVVVYFGAHQALGAMADIVGGANSYYVTHEGNVREPIAILEHTVDVLRLYNPITTVATIAAIALFIRARRMKNREGVVGWYVAAASLFAGYAAVVLQGKFYFLHWGSMIAPCTLVCALLVDGACGLLEARRPTLWAGSGAIASSAVLLLLFASSGMSAAGWLSVNVATLAYVRGKMSRSEFTDRFTAPAIGFWYRDSEEVGRWIAERTAPDDFIAVRGFQPEIYTVAHRRYPGRFFWTTFIVSPQRAYRRAEWLAEDRAALLAHPPKYVVTLRDVHEGPDSSEWFAPLGYTARHEVGNFSILERSAP